jgi:sigma-B regulation protein RsbU (phosphoserine phosphatase)
MEEEKIVSLKRELKLKKFQFSSIYEFSATLYSSFDIENIFRIFFSTLMGQLGISRLFFWRSENHIIKKKGFTLSSLEIDVLKRSLRKIERGQFFIKVDGLPARFADLKELLAAKKIHYLVDVSEAKKKIYLGLGLRFNRRELSREDIEFSFFIARFALIAIDNAIMINRLIENKRIEHEIKIARDIQLSLLPQEIPVFQNFEMAVVYEPIHEVGGDYYDILKDRKGLTPVLIADVEGKGLPAALLAASSQAVFHSLNELYFFEPAKFIAKANSLICDFTRGNRFITVFWMLIDDQQKSVTYVNAGHVEPYWISGDRVVKLSSGGFLTGFLDSASYQKETVQMQAGDVIVAFTDGVSEVENPEGQEFGEEAVVDFIQKNKALPAAEIAPKLFKQVRDFSKGKKFRDDFTLVILKSQ